MITAHGTSPSCSAGVIRRASIRRLRSRRLNQVAGGQSRTRSLPAHLHLAAAYGERSGNIEPKQSDPLSILQEARQGKHFRCVEYAAVINGCLNAIGIPSRILALKTQDVETRWNGAGHVVAEAYLRDQQCWCFIDGQWNAIPIVAGKALSAVEFQEALARSDANLEVRNMPARRTRSYFQWVRQYLYYFDTPLGCPRGRIGPVACQAHAHARRGQATQGLPAPLGHQAHAVYVVRGGLLPGAAERHAATVARQQAQ